MTNQSPPEIRPVELPGVTYKSVTAHGNVYVTVTWHQGHIFEVFVLVGKGGGCVGSQAEGLARMVSLNLRSGVDPAEIADQLKGIQCDPHWHDGKQVLSVADAVGQVIETAIARKGRTYVRYSFKNQAKR